MNKILLSILSGVFFTFIADYFLFLGVKLHYIDPLGIEVYYNVLFADNQNFFLFILTSLVVGTLIVFTDKKIYLPVVAAMYVAALSTLYPPIGEKTGEMLFMKKGVSLHNEKFTFKGDILYIGRKYIYFFDDELQKTIQLKKNEIKENIDELR